MVINFFILLLPLLLLISMVCSIIIACLRQCKVLDALLRYAAVFMWFFLSLLFPIGSAESHKLWIAACLYTFITSYFLHLLLPEIAGSIARRCRK